MKDKCQTMGHTWIVTAAPGWYRCVREVDIKLGKTSDKPSKVICCHAVGHCPGCLGYVLHGSHVVMCQAHACTNLQHLPVKTSPGRQSFSSYTTEQQSFW